MKTALFTNFSNESFTGYWDGKGRTFKPGEAKYLPDYLAAHFAKHLVNRELLKVGKEKATSPKKPQDVPEYMELFNKAYTPEETEDQSANEGDPVDASIEAANKNRVTAKVPASVAAKGPQIIAGPADDEDEDEGDAFGGKPVEDAADAE